ncbi:MAG: 2-C-methyl-D-erythritol 4-phosphate cytidylyltransferase [Oscillospiraceae bacterium]|nr:2-C-methyl-D-erythritol 4-phosphate cytidylyltransferase [Oscillospiraceae bacterium]MDD4414165.1 2-C-methyl-D-erythritol 4-phosphate cytidylyltransferase [Oscillospiraceae bacterium]
MLVKPITVYELSNPDYNDRCVAAIIVAAGNSSRMGETHKQLLQLGGVPVIARTVSAFQKTENVHKIVIVARQEDMSVFSDICRKYKFDKVLAVVCGGSTRQQSVSNGVDAIGDSADYYAIHDGARPLITPETIDMVVECSWKYGGAAAAVPVKDTIKISDDNRFILGTPDRSSLWNVQTPQVFERKIFEQALKNASVNGNDFTDDCQLVEAIGHKIYLVKSEYDNIKITTPEDIILAQRILDIRGTDADHMLKI